MTMIIIIVVTPHRRRATTPLPFSRGTPGLHNKIAAYKISARGWVAQ